jgi:hypothetical protein
MKRFTFILLLLSACGAPKMDEASSLDPITAIGNLPSTDLYSDGTGQLIKTAIVRFQVVDLKKCREGIEANIRKYSAYIEETDLKYENPLLEEHFTIRVQSQTFEPLLKELEAHATYINYRKVKSDDVEKEFIDLESRLKTKREMEQRYAEILRNSTKNTEDLLKVERQIGELHTEIEAVVSRMNFLLDQVKHSTIKLEVYQVDEQRARVVTSTPDLSSRTGESLRAGWNGLTTVVLVFLRAWPIWILLTVGWIVWRKRKSWMPAQRSVG